MDKKLEKNCQNEKNQVCTLGLTMRINKWEEKREQISQLLGWFCNAARIKFGSEDNVYKQQENYKTIAHQSQMSTESNLL